MNYVPFSDEYYENLPESVKKGFEYDPITFDDLQAFAARERFHDGFFG